LRKIIATAANKLQTNRADRACNSADTGLDIVDNLQTFDSNLLDQLGATSAPHALDFGDIMDAEDGPLALAGRCGFFTVARFLVSARKTLHQLMGHQWGGADASWLDTNFKKLTKYLAQLVEGSFIDRNGTKLAFSLNLVQSLKDSATVSTNIGAESPQIAGEIIYALVEYLGDQEFQVPCYDPGKANYKNYTCYVADVIKVVIDDAPEWRYVDEHGVTQKVYDVVGAVIAYASKTFEAAVKTLAGSLIRGVSVVGLNNEAIAEIIATAFSVAGKKVMEAFTREVLAEFIKSPDVGADFKSKVFESLKELLNVWCLLNNPVI